MKEQLISLKEIKTNKQFQRFKDMQIKRGAHMVAQNYGDFQSLNYFLSTYEVHDTWRAGVIKEIEAELIPEGKIEGILYLRKVAREWKR